jgi:hypothetical protein
VPAPFRRVLPLLDGLDVKPVFVLFPQEEHLIPHKLRLLQVVVGMAGQSLEGLAPEIGKGRFNYEVAFR